MAAKWAGAKVAEPGTDWNASKPSSGSWAACATSPNTARPAGRADDATLLAGPPPAKGFEGRMDSDGPRAAALVAVGRGDATELSESTMAAAAAAAGGSAASSSNTAYLSAALVELEGTRAGGSVRAGASTSAGAAGARAGAGAEANEVNPASNWSSARAEGAGCAVEAGVEEKLAAKRSGARVEADAKGCAAGADEKGCTAGAGKCAANKSE